MSLDAPNSEAHLSPAESRHDITEFGALRLLVIDDEPEVADVTRQILEIHGHTVHVASVPDEATTMWTQHSASIDLVICDVAMAHMRGPELVLRLAEVASPPRVFFVTDHMPRRHMLAAATLDDAIRVPQRGLQSSRD